MFQVEFSNDAKKALKKIPKDYQDKIKTIVLKLKKDPFKLDIKKLAGDSKASHRIRLGAYRIFLDINLGKKSVGIANIIRRTSKTYRKN